MPELMASLLMEYICALYKDMGEGFGSLFLHEKAASA